jgi:DNA-binding beta-propeller fold protein YncE
MALLNRAWLPGLLLGVIVMPLAGCADEDGFGSESGSRGSPNSDEDKGADSDDSDREPAPKLDAGASSGSADKAPLPPEIEVALSFDAPQAGKTSVYVPNPVTNRVAVVNANTFAIESVAVGSQPTFAATVPGEDIALVLNVGSRDAALLRTEGGKTATTAIEVGHDANAIAMAPDGQHAVIYLNANASGASAKSFQDLTIVSLGTTLAPGVKRAQRLSVGFRPRGVQFTADGKKAFVITEDGISVLDFAALEQGPTIAPLVGVGDTLRDPQSVDVQVTANGAFALARRSGDSTLRLIELANGRIETLSLRSLFPTGSGDAGVAPVGLDAGAGDGGVAPPLDPELTDLDLAPDGTFAVAVLRDLGALVRIPIPAGFRDPSTIRVRTVTDQLIGSITLSKLGTLAVAYTSAVAEESVVLVDLTSDAAPRGIRLRKAVRAVALSDDGQRVLVLHAPVGAAAPAANEDARIDASEGYSIVDAQSGFVKLQLTSARIRERDLLITPDRSHLFALQRNDSTNVRALDVVNLNSFQVASTQLTQPPIAIGFVPTVANNRQGVFVGHVSQGGMITFFDANGGAKIQEVAGFEIASRIRQ